MQMKWLLTGSLGLGLFAASATHAADPVRSVNATVEKLFATRVLPLLEAKCVVCHGSDPNKLKGGLDLRTRDDLLRGGDSGMAAVVPGKPESSPLYLSITRRSDNWSPMPPKLNDRVSDEDVAAVREWIDGGAPWPTAERIRQLKQTDAWDAKDGVTVRTSGGLSIDWTHRKYRPEDLWAYQPIRKPTIAIPAGVGPIDAFLMVKQQTLGLTPAPLCDRPTLLRRVTFDLTGLPPTPEELDAFVRDPDSEQQAFARVVDRLLASPHYGERMAQHWLDVVRYADSSGGANDYARGNAWRYRDYVVRSFNQDKPYDRFVIEQLAGDEIDSKNPELLIAAGFLRMGPWELTGMEVARVARQRYLDDVTDAVGQVFLGHPLQCARCHDHKFDPVPTRDYYALQAVFATTQLAERSAPFLEVENRTGFEELRTLELRRKWLEDELKRIQAKKNAVEKKWIAEHPERKGERPPFDQLLTPADLGMERVARKGLERLKWLTERYEPFALSVYSGRTPTLKAVYAPLRVPPDRLTSGELEQTCILSGGDPFSRKDAVTPGVLSAANDGSAGDIPVTIEGRRKAFAAWVVGPTNPLTARVLVNRLWAWHFGLPLVGNPNNFGATGKKPTHPELLDWLASRLIEEKWSIKAMHRLIVQSEAYRRSSRHPNPKLLGEKDPQGIAYAAFRARRLSAEELRDAMLVATGELNRSIGGVPCRPEMNREVAFQPRQVMGTFAEAWQPNANPEQRHRRSLYVQRLRGLRDPFFEVFNQPSPESSCELRDSSTVAPQAFALFNGEASNSRALALAARVSRETATREKALTRAFSLTLNRMPTADELQQCLAHWDAMNQRHSKLKPEKATYPREIVREALEENTGEKFRFTEPLEAMTNFVADLQSADCTVEVRGLAEVCLVLFNTNEFAYVE